MARSRYIVNLLLILFAGRVAGQIDCDHYLSLIFPNDSVYSCNYGSVTNSGMTLQVPQGAGGLAIAPSFSFQAPNPTYWTTKTNTYWYFDGTNWVNTGHTCPSPHIGGSGGKLYAFDNVVYSYNGTGNATAITSSPQFSAGAVRDIVGDKLDNFYLLFLDTPQSLNLYNSNGATLATYSLNGIPVNTTSGPAFAMKGDTVVVDDSLSLYVGTISGGVVNFTLASAGFKKGRDYASCAVVTDYTMAIAGIPSSSISCLNPTITLASTAPSGVAILTHSWSGPGVVGGAISQTVDVNAAGVYTLFSQAITGATNITTFTVGGALQLSLTASTSNTFLCSPGNVTLTASGATSYTWNPAASLSQSNGSVVIASPTGDITYTVTGETGICKDSAVVTVSVFPAVTLTITSGSTSLCAGGTASLAVAGASTFTWMPGNLSGPSVTVMPTSTTVYTVTGTVGPCIDTETMVVTNPVSIGLGKSGDLDCYQTSRFLFTIGSTTNAIGWTGPGITGTVNTNTVTVTNGGTFTLTVTDALNNCTAIDTIVVNSSIGPLPITIIPSGTFICHPGFVNLLSTTSAFYTWQPSNSVSPSTGPYVTATPSTTTEYTLSATLGVCSGSAVITISVNPTPTVVSISGSPTVCAGTNVTLAATGATSYTWNPSKLSNDTVTVLPIGNVVYTVTGETDGCFSSDSVRVTVLANPTVVAATTNSFICLGANSTITAAGAASFTWQPLASNASTIALTPTASVIYSVTGTGTNGCTNASTVEVKVSITPTIQAGATGTIACEGGSVVLTAAGATSYTWLPINKKGNIVVDFPLFPRNYTVIAGEQQCKDTAYASVVTMDCGLPSIGIANAASEPRYVDKDQYEITFSVIATNSGTMDLEHVSITNSLRQTFPEPATWKVTKQPELRYGSSLLTLNDNYDGEFDTRLTIWEKSQLIVDRSDTVTFIILVSPHGVSGQFTNTTLGGARMAGFHYVADSSSDGHDIDPDHDGHPGNNNKVTTITLPEIRLFIPQGFSPNWDGINDYFEIKGLNDRQVNLDIYNRWGERVFYKANYDNKWDGKGNAGAPTMMNGRLPEGTYYYVLKIMDGSGDSYKGFVEMHYK